MNEKNVSNELPFEHLAYHEAGHYVVGYVLDHRLQSGVTIKPDKDLGIVGLTGSEVFHVDENGYADPESARASAIELYAGYAAQVRFDPNCSDQALITSGSDYEEAAYAISAGRFAGMKETEDSLKAEAARLVEENWKAIEALAKELLEHETIQGEEAGFIVDVAQGKMTHEEFEQIRHYFR